MAARSVWSFIHEELVMTGRIIRDALSEFWKNFQPRIYADEFGSADILSASTFLTTHQQARCLRSLLINRPFARRNIIG